MKMYNVEDHRYLMNDSLYVEEELGNYVILSNSLAPIIKHSKEEGLVKFGK